MPDVLRYRQITQISALLLFVFCAYLLSSLVVSMVLMNIFSLSMAESGKLISVLRESENGQYWLLGMQGVVHGSSFLLVPLFFWLRERRHPESVVEHVPSQTPWQSYLIVALAGVALLPLIQALTIWNQSWNIPGDFGLWARQMEDQTQEILAFLTDFTSPGLFLLSLIVMAVLPGIGEELLFRGLLQNQLARLTGRRHLALWISALLFSAIHLQFYGFATRALLGVWFGYLYLWSRNLWVPMLAHFVHNGITLLFLYLYQVNITEVNPDAAQSLPPAVLIGSALLSGMLIWQIWRLCQRTHTTQTQ